jgi:hypothetical protein
MTCFECGEAAEFRHHVVPQSRGGTKTVPLCGDCHGKAHHRSKAMSSSQLTREGLARAKVRGVKLGKRGSAETARQANAVNVAKAKRVSDSYRWIARIWRDDGATLESIAAVFNALGWVTRRLGPWSTVGVHRLLAAN